MGYSLYQYDEPVSYRLAVFRDNRLQKVENTRVSIISRYCPVFKWYKTDNRRRRDNILIDEIDMIDLNSLPY